MKQITEVKMDRLGIFFGGRSNEHEISLLSAAAVISSIDRTKHELFYFGITRNGVWKHYEGPVEDMPRNISPSSISKLILSTARITPKCLHKLTACITGILLR